MSSRASKGLNGALILAALAVLAPNALADPTHVVEIEQPTATFFLEMTPAGVPADAENVRIAEPPRFSSLSGLEPIDERWELTISEDFWTAGTDSLRVAWDGDQPGSSTVHLVVARAGASEFFSFEPEDDRIDSSEPDIFGDNVTIGPEGAILGDRGLAIEVGAGPSTGFAAFTLPPSSGSGNGTGTQSHVRINDDPGGQGEGDPWPLPSEPVTIMALYSELNDRVAELEVRVRDGGPEMRVKAAGSADASAWYPFGFKTAKQVQFDSNGHRSILLVDGEVVGVVDSGNASSGGRPATVRIGTLVGTSSIPYQVQIDDIQLGRQAIGNIWHLSSEDDFDVAFGNETGGMWTHSSEAAGPIGVNAKGELEIAITNPSAWSSHRRDSSPEANRRFNVGFDVDPSLLSMADGETLILLIAYPGENLADNHVHVRLRRDGPTAFQVRADLWDDLGNLVVLPWHSISRGKHRLEMQWHAAAADGIDDGYLRLFVDGLQAGAAIGIDNDTRRIESVRIGAIRVRDGTSGTLSFDNYVTWTELP